MNELLKSKEFRFVVDYFKTMDFTNKEVYANWLAQTYYFVSHSVRLSALGAARLPVDSAVGKRMVAHTIEEKGHHTVAEKDIENLGLRLADFPAFGVTNAFYQSQYYKVMFEHPYHLLGQIFMLEAFSVEMGPWMYDIVKNAHGDKACRFVKIHAMEDIDHVEKALAAIQSFPAENQTGTAENFYQACEMYYGILKNINEASYREISAVA
ncbi:iron-containing redox enzyme family protein [Bdellovibrio sp. HCB209]|uniref:iron-containing redox enzyme family protein n=1 Tax=Bdellovibrio sp. HCB209 TaxID=3394354 RepID=UPI0039B39700